MAEDPNALQRGTIKVYFPLREFGFITRPSGRDVFFARSAFADESEIVEGAPIEFSVELTERGYRAKRARRIA